jgi:hypothetical protein
MNRNFLFVLFAVAHLCFASDSRLIETVSGLWGAEDAVTLQRILQAAETDGLAVTCLENKVREGIAKNKPSQSIIAAVEKRATALRAIVGNNKNPAIADQSNLLFESEKKLSSPGPAVARLQKKPKTISSPGHGTHTEEINSSHDHIGFDKPKSICEDKIEKRLEKQESRLEKLEQKQEKRSSNFKDKKR